MKRLAVSSHSFGAFIRRSFQRGGALIAAVMAAIAPLTPATSLAAQQTLFSETFSGNLSQWNTVGGCTITSGHLHVPASQEQMRSNIIGPIWTDYTFEGTVTIGAVAAGLVFRSCDANDFYMWQLNVSLAKLRLHRKLNGTYTAFKEIPFTFQTGVAYDVKIAATGTTIQTYINGTLIDTTVDVTFTQGPIGFRTGSTENFDIDNITITQTVPDPPAAPGPPGAIQVTNQWSGGKPVVNLAWAAASGSPDGYLLERRSTGAQNYQVLAGLNATALSFTDNSAIPETSYDYRLSAFNSGGTSSYQTITVVTGSVLPVSYLDWAHQRWPATSGVLAPGSSWQDIGSLDGAANGIEFSFNGNPGIDGNPGGLFLQANQAGGLTVWGWPFSARNDVRYRLLGSADLNAWQSYLDESASVFPQVGSGSGPAVPLLDIDLSANPQLFLRWETSGDPNASAAPSGLLLNNLASGNTKLSQTTPLFSWALADGSQTAYEILVATSPALLATGQSDVWDSGEITSSSSLNIPFAGAALQSNTTYYWTVRIWNSAGEVTSFAPNQTFQTGTLTSTYQTDPPSVMQFPIAPMQVVQVSTGHYFIDFGRDAFASLALNFPSSQAGQVVTVDLGETLSGAHAINHTPPGTIRFQEIMVTMQDGQQNYQVTPTWTGPTGSFSPPASVGQVMPFRYVEVTNVPEPFTASQITQLAAHVPFDDSAAQFTSSSQVLNDVWELSKYTVKATTFPGIYVDGDRERTPYEADSYMHQLAHYCMDRDYATARYSHEYLLTHAQWPTEWLMHSIFIAWADYLYTGDLRSLQANYNVLKNSKLLLSLERSDGLITGTTTSNSGPQPTDIVDWPQGERDGYDMAQVVKTVVSSFHYRSLVLMQQIATALGNTADATDFQNRAALALNSINTKLWDSTNNRYIDGMNASGTKSTHASMHANFFPLAFGVVPAAQQANVVAFIKTRGIGCSVYGAQYLLEALYQAGEADYALSLLTSTSIRSWGNMIYNVGSTMNLEAWDITYKSNLDWNHVWGAAPANIIPRYLMGVRPVLPGFQKMIIQPQIGSLKYAQITVPTIRGTVGVAVLENRSASYSLAVSIPANSTAMVGVPTLGSSSTSVMLDQTATTGTITGNTLWVDNVAPGQHLFQRTP